MLQALFAFLAGILTVATPCILPVLPVLLGASFSKNKFRPLFIVLGFIISFTLAAGFLSVLAQETGLNPNLVRNGGIFILALFGALLVWQKPFELLMAKLTPFISKVGIKAGSGDKGKFSAFILGAVLGIIWAPCAGPVLGSILTLIALQRDFASAIIMLLFYALGAGIPMFLIAYGGQRVKEKVDAISKHLTLIQKIFGILIILLAVAMYFNYDVKLYSIILQNSPSFNYESDIQQKFQQSDSNDYVMAPEFAKNRTWLNSQPLSMADLKGKVVLIDFWTYSCINCIRTLSYVTSWYDTYKDDGLVVVGVHTPEFAFEKDTNNVKDAISRFKINYPVVQDNDYVIWSSYDNHYWPAKYLIDKNGNIVYTHFGEGEYEKTEQLIRNLLGMQAPMPKVKEAPFPDIRSPEMYFGADRLANLSDSQQASLAVKDYIIDKNIKLNEFSLGGKWQFFKDKIVLQEDSGEINLKFSAGKVHIVASGENSATLKIVVDGQQQPDVIMSESKLYTLFDSEDYKEHFIEIKIQGQGFQAFALTFG